MIPIIPILLLIFSSGLIDNFSCAFDDYILVNGTNCSLLYSRNIFVYSNLSSNLIPLNSTYASNSTCNSTEADILLEFSSTSLIENATIKLNFVKNDFDWKLSFATLSMKCSDYTNCVDVDNDILTGSWLTAPLGVSYHCTNPELLSSNLTSIQFDKLQIQIFDVSDKFELSNDCVGFFSIPTWTILAVTVILLAILSLGFSMLMKLQTNDKLDDPKGKPIQIGGTAE